MTGSSTSRVILRGFVTLVIAVLLLILARHVMVLLHEWTHAGVAWAFGYKPSPFDIYYGDWTLLHVDENVAYARIYADGKGWLVSLVASSALVTNTVLFLLSTFLLASRAASWSRPVCLFVFWFGVANIAELFSYIPIRVFLPGDVQNFTNGLGISPWWVFVPGTILVGFGLSRAFGHDLPLALSKIGFSGMMWPSLFLVLDVFAVFFFWGGGLDAFFPAGNSPLVQVVVTSSALLGFVMFGLCERYVLRPPHGWANMLWLRRALVRARSDAPW